MSVAAKSTVTVWSVAAESRTLKTALPALSSTLRSKIETRGVTASAAGADAARTPSASAPASTNESPLTGRMLRVERRRQRELHHRQGVMEVRRDHRHRLAVGQRLGLVGLELLLGQRLLRILPLLGHCFLLRLGTTRYGSAHCPRA